jgi:hypothetical protein
VLFESSYCVTFLFEFFRPWKKALKSNVGLFVSRTLTLSFSRIIYGIMFCCFSPTTTTNETMKIEKLDNCNEMCFAPTTPDNNQALQIGTD